LELALRDLEELFRAKNLKSRAQKSEAKKMLLARDSTLDSGGKVLPLLRCALWLVGRSLRRRAGPIGMRYRQGAFHHVRTISQREKTIREKTEQKRT